MRSNRLNNLYWYCRIWQKWYKTECVGKFLKKKSGLYHYLNPFSASQSEIITATIQPSPHQDARRSRVRCSGGLWGLIVDFQSERRVQKETRREKKKKKKQNRTQSSITHGSHPRQLLLSPPPYPYLMNTCDSTAFLSFQLWRWKLLQKDLRLWKAI